MSDSTVSQVEAVVTDLTGEVALQEIKEPVVAEEKEAGEEDTSAEPVAAVVVVKEDLGADEAKVHEVEDVETKKADAKYVRDVEAMAGIIRSLPAPTIEGVVPIPNPNLHLYELAYGTFKNQVSGKGHTVGQMTVLVGVAIQVAQKIERGQESLTGIEKKAIVINMIRRWIGESPYFTAEERTYLNEVFVPLVLDGVIDGLCSLNVNAVAKKATTGLFKFCCGSEVITADRHEMVR